ncbi:hypothetical protein PoB_003887200 [Plakobranchus ocellatus]|uniref:Secreted protein n=1 Tax=Plakobranchus ocellatus TaxID=259542 RepID=A0AAV4AYJ6_9GAST|nr:hypothetical protein PoB_003887200 [Plakobranchus ocellatus]
MIVATIKEIRWCGWVRALSVLTMMVAIVKERRMVWLGTGLECPNHDGSDCQGKSDGVARHGPKDRGCDWVRAVSVQAMMVTTVEGRQMVWLGTGRECSGHDGSDCQGKTDGVAGYGP